jgi:hypothetical protein
MNATQPIRIQILAANDQAGRGNLAVGLVRQHLLQITDIAQSKGAEAMLVCPAPEAYASEGIDIVVAARFGRELAQDVLFWQQHSLADAIHHELQISAVRPSRREFRRARRVRAAIKVARSSKAPASRRQQIGSSCMVIIPPRR